MNVVVADADGVVHDADDDLDAIRARLAPEARAAIADLAPIDERRGIVTWDVGTVPQVVEMSQRGHAVRGYPALLDDDDSVSLRVLTNPDLQQRVMRGGVRRLLLLTAAPSTRDVQRELDQAGRLALAGSGVALDELVTACRVVAVDRVMDDHGELPWDADGFAALQRAVRRDAPGIAADALATVAAILGVSTRVAAAAGAARHAGRRAVGRRRPPAPVDGWCARGSSTTAGSRRLPDVHRYVRGIEYRLDRLAEDIPRDVRRMGEVLPLEQRYRALLAAAGRGPVGAELVDVGWLLEELRVSVFAQPVGVHGPVSPKRVRQRLDQLGLSRFRSGSSVARATDIRTENGRRRSRTVGGMRVEFTSPSERHRLCAWTAYRGKGERSVVPGLGDGGRRRTAPRRRPVRRRGGDRPAHAGSGGWSSGARRSGAPAGGSRSPGGP